MGKCDCFETRTEVARPCNYKYGVCTGAKETSLCSCGGDKSKCDFYPEKRKEAIKPVMNTAEMWLKAQEDGKTYVVEQKTLCYSKERGLFCSTDLTPCNYLSNFRDWVFDKLLSLEWTEMQEEIMTKAEAEEKFGVRIVG